MSIETGGPAFPTDNGLEGGPACVTTGMTLRDYFAAKAMQAFIDQYFKGNGMCFGMDHLHRNVPAHAYKMADAMLAARSNDK